MKDADLGATLVEGQHYNVMSYQKLNDAQGRVTVKGVGNYGGTAARTFDVLTGEDDPTPDRQLVMESLRSEIDTVLQTLNERERSIIKAFFGIDQPEMTMEEIGSKYGLTRERVRQIKEKAIRRLRNNTKNKMLKTYLGQ